MLKQSIGMTENNAKQIAEMYLSRYNPTYCFVVRGCYLLRGRRCCHIRAVQFVLQSLGLPDGKRHLPSVHGYRRQIILDPLCEPHKMVIVR